MNEQRRWAVRPLPPGASKAERRWHMVEEHDARHQIANIWYQLFEDLRFVHRKDGVPTAVVKWDEPPQLGRVTLGPPTRFTVRPRPGLLRKHLVDIDDLLASAFQVHAITVTDLSAGWLSVEMIEVPRSSGIDETAQAPIPADPPTVDRPWEGASTSRARWHRIPLGHRDGRRPFGGPRSAR